MKYRFLILLSITILSACNTPQRKSENTFYFCGVVFGFQISPDGVLEKVVFYPPNRCGGGLPDVEVSAAWMKTACAHQSIQNTRPTYDVGKEPTMRYAYYLINPNRPDVVYPTKTAGSSEQDPVIYVQDSILNNDKTEHACDRITVEPRS